MFKKKQNKSTAHFTKLFHFINYQLKSAVAQLRSDQSRLLICFLTHISKVLEYPSTIAISCQHLKHGPIR